MKVPCSNPTCGTRRRHHEDPYTERGTVMMELPDDWKGKYAYCSLTCAAEAGYSLLRMTDPCPKCLVAYENQIQHSKDWKCDSPEVTEEQVAAVNEAMAQRARAFIQKYGTLLAEGKDPDAESRQAV